MGNTQSVIVYRNRAEAMFWESGMAFPLIAALVIAFIVFLGSASIADKIARRNGKFTMGEGPTWICALLAAVAGCLTFYFLF